ncbi:V-type ATP synthase subunit D, partial [Candidatus Bathyarchaeota archaeon]
MSEIVAGARPTRMELIALRRRRRIAQRGGDLLREKLDALMIEFFQFAREITALRQKTQDLLFQAYEKFAEAQMLMGFTRVEETSLTVQDRFDVDASTRNVIGVSIPYVSVKLKPLEGFPYSMIG